MQSDLAMPREDKQADDQSAGAVRYRLNLFGNFALCTSDGTAVTGLARKTRGLIAYLALTRGVASREDLAELLWGNREPEQARASLRQACYDLRKVLPAGSPLLAFERDEIALVRDSLTSDIDFIDSGMRDTHRLSEVLRGGRGTLLRDLDGLGPGFDDWLTVERTRRADERRAVVLGMARKALAEEQWEDAHCTAVGLLALDRTDREAVEIAMHAVAELGRPAAAQELYAQHSSALRRDLDEAPAAGTSAMLGEIMGRRQGREAAKAPLHITRLAPPQPQPVAQRGVRALNHAPVIEKVGISAVVDGQAAGAEPADSTHLRGSRPVAVAVRSGEWTRRAVWVGLAGAATTAAWFDWLRSSRHSSNARAIELYRHGQAIQKTGVLENMGEAIEAYEQALAINPRNADAWGALALSYRYPVVGPIVRLGDPQEVRAPAQRALALDPGNADAQLALIFLYPLYRRWWEYEMQLRAFLREHPDSALGHTRLGWLLLNVGRIEEAVTVAQRAVSIDPTRQIAWLYLAFAYYYAGRDEEGDLAIEEGRSRWPQAWRFYLDGYYFLLYGKRYEEARAYIADPGRRPRVLRREMVEGMMHEADVFASGRGLAELKNRLRRVPASIKLQDADYTAPAFALLGLVDDMFIFFEAFFFGGVVNGRAVDPPGPLDPRSSCALFAPAVLSLRSDVRFASLLARIGLEEYSAQGGDPA